MSIFPNNTISSFKTLLANRVSLKGEWEVGLVELSYPCKFETLPNNDFVLSILARAEDGEKIQYHLVYDKVYFQTVTELIDFMKTDALFRECIDITLGNDSKVKINLKGQAEEVYFSESLLKIFGIEGDLIDYQYEIQGVKNVDLKILAPRQIFVYTDFIEQQYVGDVMSPLLRVVTVENLEKDQAVHVFTHPHYVPVVKREFQQIEIDIRDNLGNNIPFVSGCSTVKLHFRKVA